MRKENPELGEKFKEVIRNQMKDNDPKITNETFKRLLKEGNEENEAIRLMACVISAEIYDMMKEERKFDEDKYEKMMKKLPKMPWE